MTFPNDVPGWLTLKEGCKLAELATGRHVLEIGSYCGRSTICLAQTAKKVHCIDTFDGRGTPQPRSTFLEFKANLEKYGAGASFSVGTSEQVIPKLDQVFDLVFIDGSHDYQSVMRDAKLAQTVLRPGGLLVFHDYHQIGDPDVTAAVDELCFHGAEIIETCESLAVVKVTGVSTKPTAKPLVALAMPMRGDTMSRGAAEGYYLWPTKGRCDVVRLHTVSSLLDFSFNRVWATALNLRESGITHFSMIHNDVGPEQGWLDILMDELRTLNADVVSAAIPIKDHRGLTSTAVASDDPWTCRRITMTELFDLPETFTSSDVGGPILLNTGLWVCDLRKDWVEKVHFQSYTRIVLDSTGQRQAQTRPEDWEFSRSLHALGVTKLYATRKVKIRHLGEMEFANESPWGTMTHDTVFERLIKENGDAGRSERTDCTGQVRENADHEREASGDFQRGRGSRAACSVGAALD